MAAGYTLKELMEFMGHSDLQMVQRYTKLLPQPTTRRSGSTLTSTLAAVADSLAQAGYALAPASSSAELDTPLVTTVSRGRSVAVRCGRTTRC
jgi:hypothetical protein